MVYHSQSILWFIGKLCIFIGHPVVYIRLCSVGAVDIVRVIKNHTCLPIQELVFYLLWRNSIMFSDGR